MDVLLTPAEIGMLFRRSGWLLAIKAVRDRTGLGLKESKRAVDAYAVELGLRVHVQCNYCGGAGTVTTWKGEAR